MNVKHFLLIIFFVSYASCSNVIAADVANKAKELTGLQTRIKKVNKKLNELKLKKSALLSELKSLDMQYGKSAVFLKQLESHIKRQRIVLEESQQQIEEKLHQIDSQKHVLELLVKAAYGMGRNEKLKLMLNQQDPALSGRVMVYYDYFNKSRLKEISKINLDLRQLRDLEAQRLKEAALLEEKLEKRKLERIVLLETKTERKALLVKINGQFASKKQQLSRYKASEKRLKSLISSLQQTMDDFPFEEGAVKEFARLKGKLPWPTKGKLVKKFGAQRSESKWDGVLIRAKEGANIRVVTRGRVVYADWLRGYGLLTIIDHGKGYMTLYAFNQSLYKSVGDWVDAGTIIASVGQSGGQTDTGLYFGIRKKGKPVNPVKWCRKVRHGKVG
jgi:septal ring factor EnvC (AmiA/AmiB activator)